MKRLLASGSGPIFQITRGFRDGELGRLHNPEFSILEWYRPGFDHHTLMDEVEALVRRVLARGGCDERPFRRTTYRGVFRDVLGLDPVSSAVSDLAGYLTTPPPEHASRDEVLNLLLVERIEPALAREAAIFVVDYPASQAALARLRLDDPAVAERFELYVRGIELANGYHELLDPAEQRRRFEAANDAREREGRARLPMDERFLAALAEGLPACAGVALGLDRLVMVALGYESIRDVITFPVDRA